LNRWFPNRITPGPKLKRGLAIFYALCAALFLIDFLPWRHAENPLDGLWGFYAFYGFVACVALVLIAKWMRTFLMRDQNYYDNGLGEDGNADD